MANVDGAGASHAPRWSQEVLEYLVEHVTALKNCDLATYQKRIAQVASSFAAAPRASMLA